MEVTDPEPTADLDTTSELEPAAEMEDTFYDCITLTSVYLCIHKLISEMYVISD